MCYYITAAVAPARHDQVITSCAKNHGFAWQPVERSPMFAFLEDDEGYFLTTRGHCDCDTDLGSLRRRPSPQDHSRKARKLERKGWGATKIRRWLDDKSAADAKLQARFDALERDGSGEANRWFAFLDDAVGGWLVKRIGILLHWYRGDIEKEDVPVTGRTRRRLVNSDPSFLLSIEEDHLYDFFR